VSPKVSQKPARKECNAIMMMTDKMIEVCTQSTVITCGPAKLCRDHQRRWNATGTIRVWAHGRVRTLKVRS
jgi:hypothetical protein